MADIRTTVFGILTVLSAIATAGIEFINTGTVSSVTLGAVFTAIMTALGFYNARDSKTEQ